MVILTLVLYVEVRMRIVMILQPAVSDETRVGLAHEFLTKHICTMIDVLSPLFVVSSRELRFLGVVFWVGGFP